MTPEQAIQRTVELFPFSNYMSTGSQLRYAYLSIARTVLKYIGPGASVLDFGCGPCDKTAILQFLGFKCSACDDLLDEWHKEPGVRDEILNFAKRCGIDFSVIETPHLPFSKESFDMVMLHDVLEHLHDSPRDLVCQILSFCKPEGLLFVTVPNAVNIRKRLDVLFGRTNLPDFEHYFWYPSPWRGHVREYVRDDIVKLCRYLDLDILELRGCDHMLQKLPKFMTPMYLGITNLMHSLKDSWLLVAKKPRTWETRIAADAPQLGQNATDE